MLEIVIKKQQKMLENALKNAKKRKKCEKMLDNVRKCL